MNETSQPPSAGYSVPSPRALVAIFCLAVTLRLVLFALVTRLHGLSAFEVAQLADGGGYLVYAHAMGGGSTHLVDHWSYRIFPGYPLLIAAGNVVGLPLHVSALVVNWLAAGLTAAGVAVLFRDSRLGWAMATLLPSYLMYSTLAMTEPTLLLYTVLGLLAAEHRSIAAAGLLLGFAGTIRPTACFAVMGYLIYLALQHRWRHALAIGLLYLGVVGAALAAIDLLLGDVLHSYRTWVNNPAAYGGQLLTVPFRSLILTPQTSQVPPWKVVYIWACVIFTLLACFLLARQAWHVYRRNGSLGCGLPVAVPWAFGNTLFILSLGGVWGFHEFHRFMLPALPALLLAYRELLPRGVSVWLLVALLSAAPALYGLSRQASRLDQVLPSENIYEVR